MKLIFILLLTCIVGLSYGQTFRGCVPSFSSKTISVFEYEDFFTRTRLEKFNAPLDSSGNFSFSYFVSEPLYVDVFLGGTYSGIFIQPGFEYELLFDVKGKMIEVRSVDPTNKIIDNFDAQDFALFEFQKKKTYPVKIKEFVDRQKIELEKLPPFARLILRYRMSARELRGYFDSGDTVALNEYEKAMFFEGPIRNTFPDYISALGGYYYDRANNFSTRRTPFDSQHPFASMTNEFDFIKNDSIRQFAYLVLLSETYTASWGPPKDKINQLIDSIHDMSANEKVRKAALLLKRKNNLLTPGTPIRDFSFETSLGESHSLSDFKGKYVLLDFWFIGCSECVKSFPNLKSLKQQANGKLEIISLTPYDSSERLAGFLQKRSQFNWIFSPIDKNNGLLNYFSIGGFPTYFLISTDGTLIRRFDFVHEKDLKTIIKLIE